MRTTIHVGVAVLAVNLLSSGTAFAEVSDAAPEREPAPQLAAPRHRAHALHPSVLPEELRAAPRVDVAQGGDTPLPPPPPEHHEGKFPVRFVDRPLTLPKFMLSPKFLFDITHEEAFGVAANGFGLTLGASFGILDDLEVYLDPLSLLILRTEIDTPFGGINDTKVYYGTFRLGATYRFVKTEIADVGARLEFGASGAADLIHLTWGVPVVLRFAHLIRLTTGLFFSGLFPTNNSTVTGISRDPDIAMAAVSDAAPVLLLPAGPGIPVTADIQILEPLFAGIDTGFGILSFRGRVDQNCFMPLGFHIGGTIPTENKKPLVDLVGAFSFPVFLVGADGSPPFTNIWTVGLNARAYFQL
jgi:hypothetical protein